MSEFLNGLAEHLNGLFRGDSDNQFVTLHKLPEPLPAEFLDSASSLGDIQRARQRLTITVNQIPNASVIWHPKHQLLWDVYSSVLSKAEIGQPDVDFKTQNQLLRAEKLILEYGKQYESYQEKVSNLELEANRIRQDVKSSEGAGQTKAENKLQEIEAQLQMLNQQWVIDGKKVEIDEAYATIENLRKQSPNVYWSNLKDKFANFKRTSAELNNVYYETHFLPLDFHETLPQPSSWLEMSRFTDVDTVGWWRSFSGLKQPPAFCLEVRRIKVNRPWFVASLLTERFWRFDNKNLPILSDGKPSPKGELPAYISELLIGRVKDESKSFVSEPKVLGYIGQKVGRSPYPSIDYFADAPTDELEKKNTEPKTPEDAFLQLVYELSQGDENKIISRKNLGTELGLTKAESDQITRDLFTKGLLKRIIFNSLTITPLGIRKAKAERQEANEFKRK